MELLERERQLKVLTEVLESVRAGGGRLALISGEAGIGKTSLVRHFTSQQAGRAEVYWGTCDALFTPRPLGPFSDIAFRLRSDLLEMIQTSPNWYRVAMALLRELIDRQAPVILVVEDIHWADATTLDMLKFLGRRIQQTRVLLILTFRDDERTGRRLLAHLTGDLPSEATVRVELSPLSETSVDEMAKRANRQLEGLFAITGGNPFFVAEMLESEPGAVPSSVRDLVLARVSRLAPAARDLAEVAALTPGGAEFWLLGSIFHDPAEAIDACVEQGVLWSDGERLAFRHELARRTVENQVSPGRARRFHAQILEALLRRGAEAGADAGENARTEGISLARIVHHAAHAGDFAALLHYAPAAARQASRLGAHREAAVHYQIVLNQLISLAPETRAELLEGRSYECYLIGEIGASFAARQQATAIWKNLQRVEREGDNLRWLSRLAWFSGRPGEAEQFAQAAVETLEQTAPGPQLAMAYSNRSQLHMLSEDTAPARYWGERAIELAERLGAAGILVHALTNVGTAEIIAGQEQGWGRLVRALGLARDMDLQEDAGRAYANLSSMAVRWRDYEQAAKWLEEGLAYTDEHELDSYRALLLGSRAQLRFETGSWELAEADAGQAIKRHAGGSVIPIQGLTLLGHLKARRGDEDGAVWLAQAGSLSSSTQEVQWIGPLAAANAELAWWRGQRDQVESSVQPGLLLALRHSDPWMLGQLAYWVWRAGGTLSQILPEWLARPYRLMIAGEWQAAAEAWRQIRCPFEAALALSEGDPAAQIEALAIFERLGARPAAEALKHSLRRSGVKGVPRGPRPATRGNPAGLTNRELEVLALLAEGLSDASIADRLSISRKTAGHHVSAVLGKLQAGTRSEAVALARRQGMLP